MDAGPAGLETPWLVASILFILELAGHADGSPGR